MARSVASQAGDEDGNGGPVPTRFFTFEPLSKDPPIEESGSLRFRIASIVVFADMFLTVNYTGLSNEKMACRQGQDTVTWQGFAYGSCTGQVSCRQAARAS